MWCGFDEQMREGMRVYGVGIAKAIAASAQDRKATLGKQLEAEASELRTLRDVVESRLATATCDGSVEVLRLAAFRGMIAIAELLIAESGDPKSLADFVESLGNYGFRLGTLIETYEVNYKKTPLSWSHQQRASSALDACFSELIATAKMSTEK